MGVRGIDYENLNLDIYKGTIGTEEKMINFNHQNSVSYPQLFGLDETDQSGTIGQPDDKIDNNEAILDFYSGLLFFPDRRPFDTDVGHAINYPDSVLADRVPTIYDSGNHTERRNASQYYIEVRTRIRGSRFSLGHVNIIPESEVVTLDGRRLTRGVDYGIEYDIGRIEFLINEIRDPNSQLTICYEYCPTSWNP